MLRLSQWINGGTPPPSGQPIDVVGGAIQRDSLGIALDGIRLPEMDVPTLTQQGIGNSGPGFCILFGREIPLPVSLSSLYSNHEKYVSKFAHATNALESGGFLLEPDAEAGQPPAAQSAVSRHQLILDDRRLVTLRTPVNSGNRRDPRDHRRYRWATGNGLYPLSTCQASRRHAG